MKPRLLILAFAFALGAVPALADDGAKSRGDAGGHSAANRIQAGFTLTSDAAEAEPPEDNGRGVEIPTVVTPVFEDGRLLNYIFVHARLIVKKGLDPWKVRDQSHILRDAMIRAAHHESLADPSDPRVLDRDRAAKVWQAAANEALHSDSIVAVQFLSADSRQ